MRTALVVALMLCACGPDPRTDPIVTNGVEMLIQGMTRISDGDLECGLWVVDGKVKAAWQINNF